MQGIATALVQLTGQAGVPQTGTSAAGTPLQGTAAITGTQTPVAQPIVSGGAAEQFLQLLQQAGTPTVTPAGVETLQSVNQKQETTPDTNNPALSAFTALALQEGIQQVGNSTIDTESIESLLEAADLSKLTDEELQALKNLQAKLADTSAAAQNSAHADKKNAQPAAQVSANDDESILSILSKIANQSIQVKNALDNSKTESTPLVSSKANAPTLPNSNVGTQPNVLVQAAQAFRDVQGQKTPQQDAQHSTASLGNVSANTSLSDLATSVSAPVAASKSTADSNSGSEQKAGNGNNNGLVINLWQSASQSEEGDSALDKAAAKAIDGNNTIDTPRITSYAATQKLYEMQQQLVADKPLPSPAEQVNVRIHQALHEGKTDITLKLEPAELGKVDIRLDIGRDGMVKAHIIAERPETLEMLQRDARQLERALLDNGLKADAGQMSFNLKGDGDHTQQMKEQRNVFEQYQNVRIPNEEEETILQALIAYRQTSGSIDLHV
ncbi:MAG: flagellar hook-length control protein FliK [Hyphomicrobiales bacterium]|nr:flagellar hook-length control protein FliK [Hyphomicrobiales bacterium]